MSGLGEYPGVGNGNPLQFSCLENPMDTGAWWATTHRVTESHTHLSGCITAAASKAPVTCESALKPCGFRLQQAEKPDDLVAPSGLWEVKEQIISLVWKYCK